MRFLVQVLVLTAAVIVHAAHAQPLTVVVQGVKNAKGMILVGLCNSEKDFMKTMWQSKSIQAKAGEVQATFDDVPPGTYAISIVHDVNQNGKMDSNAAGIPKEGFGFSNNAMGIIGPPAFELAKFEWDGQKKIEIKLKYF